MGFLASSWITFKFLSFFELFSKHVTKNHLLVITITALCGLEICVFIQLNTYAYECAYFAPRSVDIKMAFIALTQTVSIIHEVG